MKFILLILSVIIVLVILVSIFPIGINSITVTPAPTDVIVYLNSIYNNYPPSATPTNTPTNTPTQTPMPIDVFVIGTPTYTQTDYWYLNGEIKNNTSNNIKLISITGVFYYNKQAVFTITNLNDYHFNVLEPGGLDCFFLKFNQSFDDYRLVLDWEITTEHLKDAEIVSWWLDPDPNETGKLIRFKFKTNETFDDFEQFASVTVRNYEGNVVNCSLSPGQIPPTKIKPGQIYESALWVSSWNVPASEYFLDKVIEIDTPGKRSRW